MDAFDNIEERIRRKEKELEAREIRARLKEIENELDKIPVTPTYKHEESATKKTRGLLQQMSDVGKFALIIFCVVAAVRFAALAGYVIMICSLAFIAYKLFVENKS